MPAIHALCTDAALTLLGSSPVTETTWTTLRASGSAPAAEERHPSLPAVLEIHEVAPRREKVLAHRVRGLVGQAFLDRFEDVAVALDYRGGPVAVAAVRLCLGDAAFLERA